MEGTHMDFRRAILPVGSSARARRLRDPVMRLESSNGRRQILGATFAALLVTNTLAQTDSKAPTWQDQIARRLVPYHQLTVDDFRVDDSKHPEGDCWVQTFIDPHYRYVEKMSEDGTVYTYVTDWVIFSGLDKNETVRKSNVRDVKAQLPYLQGLFDLAEIPARELAALSPEQLPSGQGDTFQAARTNLDEKIKALTEEKFTKARAEMAAFQKATRMGKDQKKARELGVQIRKRLEALPPVPTPVPSPSRSPSAPASPTSR